LHGLSFSLEDRCDTLFRKVWLSPNYNLEEHSLYSHRLVKLKSYSARTDSSAVGFPFLIALQPIASRPIRNERRTQTQEYNRHLFQRLALFPEVVYC
jgi:hypothetical protein